MSSRWESAREVFLSRWSLDHIRLFSASIFAITPAKALRESKVRTTKSEMDSSCMLPCS